MVFGAGSRESEEAVLGTRVCEDGPQEVEMRSPLGHLKVITHTKCKFNLIYPALTTTTATTIS